MSHGFKRRNLAPALLVFGFCSWAFTGAASASQITFNDIQYWVGSGSNRAGFVVDWADGKTDTSLVWGFKWDGVATGETMLKAIVEADPRLFAHVTTAGKFGVLLDGLGYDQNHNGAFGTSVTESFDAGGLATSDTSHDGSTPTEAGDHWREGGNTDGFWGYWDGGSADSPVWGFAQSGMGGRTLTNGIWDGWSYAPGFNGLEPAAPVAAQVPEPATIGLLGVGCIALLARRRRSVARKSCIVAAAVGAIGSFSATGATAAYTYDPNDFAVSVVSHSIDLDGTGTYNDPASVLGRPTLKFNNSFNPNLPDFHRAKLVEPAFGEKTLTTLALGSSITVKMGRPVTNDPGNPHGIDFIIFGNDFYSGNGGGFPDDTTNLNNLILNGTDGAEPVVVSVSSDGQAWKTFSSGPYGDSAFPTNSYLWNRNAAAWTDTESDPTRPVNPALSSSIAGKSAADVLDLYDGSAGGTGFDLDTVGLSSIQYVRIEGITNFAGGEIDAIADVHAVPEPAAMSVLALGAAALLRRRRR